MRPQFEEIVKENADSVCGAVNKYISNHWDKIKTGLGAKKSKDDNKDGVSFKTLAKMILKILTDLTSRCSQVESLGNVSENLVQMISLKGFINQSTLVLSTLQTLKNVYEK